MRILFLKLLGTFNALTIFENSLKKGLQINMRTLGIIIFMSMFLGINLNFADGAILPSESAEFYIIGNGTHIDSFDFSVENIKYDDVMLGSITTLRKHDTRYYTMPSNGGQLLYTENGVHVNVTTGNVKLSFKGYAGLIVTFASGAGNSFEFEPESFAINAAATNPDDVLVQLEAVENYIPPGKRTQIVEIDLLPEASFQRFGPNMQGNTPAVIFGSAHLDVSTIEIGSLCIEDLGMRVRKKAHDMSAIVPVDNDPYPDLIVMFEDISNLLKKGVSFATLKGILSDGTIINGKANILVSH